MRARDMLRPFFAPPSAWTFEGCTPSPPPAAKSTCPGSNRELTYDGLSDSIMVTTMESVPYTFGIRHLAEFVHKRVINYTSFWSLKGTPVTC